METKVIVDTMWVLITAMLVFFMNLGFAAVESGFARAKNTVNIMSKNFIVFGISSIGFLILGWGLMFGDGNGFLGMQGLFFAGGADNSPAMNDAYRGIPIEVNLLKKVRLEIAVNENSAEKTVNAIVEGARTGQIGDGKIFVTDLPECIRIRTGERGSAAIGFFPTFRPSLLVSSGPEAGPADIRRTRSLRDLLSQSGGNYKNVYQP